MSVEKVSPDDKKPNARYSKYTDPYRTSSSSYKPPMTKDAILNKKEPAQGETSIFSAFSYIKHMFTGNPDSSSNTKSVSNQGKHDLTKESKIKGDKTVPVKNDPRKSDSKDLVVHDLVASQSHDKVNSGRLSPVASNLTSVGSHKPDSKGSKTNVKLSERYNKPTQKSKNEPKGELPNYKPVRFVENRSTYLHTPEKQGTASFRVTTATKSSTIPMPTILSPIIDKHMKDISTSAAKMKGSKYNRKQSTSPVKVDKKDKFQSRLRSKSTQDNTASTTRPIEMRKDFSTLKKAKMAEHWQRLNDIQPPCENTENSESREETTKSASWDTPRRRNSARLVSAENEGERTPIRSRFAEKVSTTASDFITSLKASAKGNSSDQDEKSRDKGSPSPARKTLESAVDAAKDLISNWTPIKKTESNPDVATDRVSPPSPGRSMKSRASETSNSSKEDPPPAKESSLSATFAMISSYVQKSFSPVSEGNDSQNEESPVEKKETTPSPVENRFGYLKKRESRSPSPPKESSFLKSRQDSSPSSVGSDVKKNPSFTKTPKTVSRNIPNNQQK